MFAIVIGLLVVAAPSAGAEQRTHGATVSILHGLPNFTYDFYLNGTLTLDGFKPFLATEPLRLSAGRYDLAIRDVGAPASSAPDVEVTATFEDGKNYSVIAHVTPDGEEALTVFLNDLSPIPTGKSRIVIRSVAEAPAVDIRLNGKTSFPMVTSEGQPAADLSPGTYSVEAVRADDHSLLVDGTRLSAQEGTEIILYLVGTANDGTLDFMVQTLADIGSKPTGIFSGSGGLAARTGVHGWAVLLLILGACGAVGSLLQLHPRSPRSA
jgi:hypothetical protein